MHTKLLLRPTSTSTEVFGEAFRVEHINCSVTVLDFQARVGDHTMSIGRTAHICAFTCKCVFVCMSIKPQGYRGVLVA